MVVKIKKAMSERKLRKMDDEVWKKIPIARGKYEVSNYGRIKSYSIDKVKGRIIKMANIKKFFSICIPVKEGFRKTLLVHKLVAEAFVKKPSAKCTNINHIDFNPSNNYYKNLEWVTREAQYERILGHLQERNRELAKIRKPLTYSKLKVTDVKVIKSMLAKGVIQAKIAKMFCVSEMQITRIKRGENWSEVLPN